MSTRLEVLDSEDEGSDYSPERTPMLQSLTPAAETPSKRLSTTNSFETTNTTDSSLFRNVYDDNCASTPYASNLDTGRKQITSQLNTSSVPLTGKGRNTHSKTPVGRQEDPWEVPSSPPEQTASRTAPPSYASQTLPMIAEQAAQNLYQSTGLPDESDEVDLIIAPEVSARGAMVLNESWIKKFGPRNTPTSAQRVQESTSESTVSTDRQDIANPSLAGPSGVSLYVAPTPLTKAQKEEYLFLPSSSEARQDGYESLPTIVPTQLAEGSSGASTVAYGTPSEFASSGRKAAKATESSSAKKKKLNSIEEELPQSSPDILSISPDTGKGKRDRTATDQLLTLEPTQEMPTTRSQRTPARQRTRQHDTIADDARRSDATNQAEDFADELHQGPLLDDDLPPTMEGWVPPEDETAEPEAETPIVEVEQVITTALPTAKKRGRKKKENKSQSTASHEQVSEAPVTSADVGDLNAELEVAVEPPAKKRRGRPRKSDNRAAPKPQREVNELALEEEGFEETAQEESVIDTEPPPPEPKKKRGRKRKQETIEADEASEPGGLAAKRVALESVAGNSMTEEVPPPGDEESVADDKRSPGQETPKVDKSAKQVKELAKITPSAQPGKIAYRVGLSKRSRIAPLLKSLRK